MPTSRKKPTGGSQKHLRSFDAACDVLAVIGFSFGLTLATTTIVYVGRLERSVKRNMKKVSKHSMN